MIRFILPLLMFSACVMEQDAPLPQEEQIPSMQSDEQQRRQQQLDSLVDARMALLDLVNIQALDPRIQVDLKYAGDDNFMHQVLYDTLRHLYLQREVAERLVKVQDFLDSLRPGYRLLIYDGVRPRQVQQEMWDALDSIPRIRRGKFVSNPALGSVHNFGAAVDLTLVDAKGKVLDMGAAYDEFSEIAFPSHEARFRASGELSAAQLANRQLLRRVMCSQGFSNIPSEWWHFNAYTRITASQKFQLLETESGKGRWFKITVEPALVGDSSAAEE
jgi:D-alanyl-D-alanine dipeptidase